MIAVIPLHGGFHGDAVFFRDGIDRLRNEARLLRVQMFDKGFHPARIFQHDFPRLALAQIFEHNAHAGVQEGQLAQAMLQRLAVIFRHGEGRRRCHKAHRRTCINTLTIFALRALALLDQWLFGQPAINKAAIMLFAIAVNGQIKPVRQRVHNRDTHPVQAA